MSYLESEILGCFIKDNTLLKETILTREHFEEETHKKLFDIMIKLAMEDKAVDHVSMLSAAYDSIIEMGGPGVISDIESRGLPENFETYERELFIKYKDRKTKQVVNEWLSSGKKDRSWLIDSIAKIEDEGSTDEVDVMSLLTELHDEVNNPVTSPLTGIPSGIKELDSMTSGWQPENSIIMGARPSMGKTALMLKFALSAAENGDVPIIFSLEMSAKSLLRRMTTSKGWISGLQARTPQNMTKSMQEKWINTVGELSNLDFEIHDSSFQTIQFIRSKVRKAQKKYEGKRLVVLIDYLTLIENEGNFNSDHSKYSDVSRKLKALAKDYYIPVITLAQLSRGVEQRQDKRPLPSDLRESGSIEQDADIILMLYRESYYNKQTENPNKLEIILAKQREGATGTVEVDYNRSTGVMKDWN